MKIRTASLCHQLDKVWVEVRDMPLRAWLVPEITAAACDLLGQRLCTPYEWAWKIRWGPADEDGLADRSLGHQWLVLGNWLHLPFAGAEKTVARIPVTHDWVRENWPDHDLPDRDDEE